MKKKIIKDLVHGYIEIDATIEKIINSLNFQRLKDIRQLTAQHVFPSANHNRFEHSLGVMFLADKAFLALRGIFQNMRVDEQKLNKLDINIRVAALLHDIGHAPFSHLGEKYFQRPEKLKENISILLKKKGIEINEGIFRVNSSKHELMSCYVIIDKYYDLLKDIEDFDLELVCRCILGATYNRNKWEENIIIRLINSDTIDVDKLDYLMRDAAMTTVSVPYIDVSRLFKNIHINSKTKRMTFNHRALSVLQNIIEARDSMYLWVYNHHVVVYTDFLIEYYIKHLILNYEKDNGYRDKLDPEDFFSCEAISVGFVSDSDLWSLLKSFQKYDGNISEYTQRTIPQLLERNFLKPMWKTIYEFREFMNRNIRDDIIRSDVVKKIGDSEDSKYRVYVVKKLIEQCDLRLGEIFIIPRSNKFYSLKPENSFSVYVNNTEKMIDTLLPQKKYGELHSNVAFYVFGKKDKLESIRENLVKILNCPLPDELGEITKTPKWLL